MCKHRVNGVGFIGVGVCIFGGSCFRLAWVDTGVTLFDLLPGVALGHPLLIGEHAA